MWQGLGTLCLQTLGLEMGLHHMGGARDGLTAGQELLNSNVLSSRLRNPRPFCWKGRSSVVLETVYSGTPGTGLPLPSQLG